MEEVADKIKKFFEKKKRDAKFSVAGPGYKLSDSSKPKPVVEKATVSEPRVAPSEDARQAGAAALNRLASSSNFRPSKHFNDLTSVSTPNTLESTSRNMPTAVEVVYSAKAVYFKCPLLSDEVLTKEEWKVRIEEFINEQCVNNEALGSCLKIYNLNRPLSKIPPCIEVISAYLNNIILHPDEEKYKKIRLNNKAFKEKVSIIVGSEEFLLSAGFVKTTIGEEEEEFYVYPHEKPDTDHLQFLLDALQNCETIHLELDRNLQVLQSSLAADRMVLPDDFFNLTVDEIKAEQKNRAERLENMSVLKTKAMREREEQKNSKKYKFSLIRVRFPDGIILQGTFGVYEKLGDLKKFVKENLENTSDEFTLTSNLGTSYGGAQDEDTLLKLNLVPAVLLNFRWTTDPEKNVSQSYLKPDVLALLQSLS